MRRADVFEGPMSSPTLQSSSNATPPAFQLRDPAHNNVFFKLETGDAVGQQTARTIVPIIDRHLHARAPQHVRRRQPAGARADDADTLIPFDASVQSRAPSLLRNAVSVRYFSTEPIVTVPCPDCSITQLPSHRRSCGQMRPQISGNVFVAWLTGHRLRATAPRAVRRSQSGMLLCSGQWVWQ